MPSTWNAIFRPLGGDLRSCRSMASRGSLLAPWPVAASSSRRGQNLGARQLEGRTPFWKQLLKKIGPKEGAMNAAHAHAHHRPHRALAAAATGEVVVGDDDLRPAIGRLVHEELGVLGCRRQ